MNAANGAVRPVQPLPYAALLALLADRRRWRVKGTQWERHGYTPAQRRRQFVEGWEAGQAVLDGQGRLL